MPKRGKPKTAKQRPGPKARTLVLSGKWTAAVKKALKKKLPD
jgi:hypothetical protein